MYYFLRQDCINDNSYYEVSGHNEETSKYIWISGQRFENEHFTKPIYLDPEYGQEHIDLYSTSVPVMSNRLIEQLRNLGVTNLDTYPALLKDKKSEAEFNGYSLVNVIGQVDAIDHAKSVGKKRPGRKQFRYSKLVLDEEKVEGQKLFRLQQIPSHIVVSEEIASCLKNSALRGVLIQELSEFSGF